MNRTALIAFSLCLLGGAFYGSAHAEALNVSNAWVREAPPTSAVNAAYMQLANPGATQRVITGARSAQFERVEIHRTEIVDGMARMTPQDKLPVPANGSVTLEPNGLHLMLIQAKQPLRAGDHVMIDLQLEDGASVTAHAEVRSGSGEAEDHSQHQHMHH